MTAYPVSKLLSPSLFFRRMWAERFLISQFTRREFQARHKGSMLGIGWSLVVPLVMLSVYTFVFSIVFQARWGGAHDGAIGGAGEESRAVFAVVLFGNLIAFNLFSELVSSASGLIIHNPNLVKKVVFPLEILPVSRLLTIALQSLASFLILAVGAAIAGVLKWQFAVAPLFLLPLILLGLGLSYFVAAITVFVRDTAQLMGLVVTVLIFLSPVFYPLQSVPEPYRSIVVLNPLTMMLEHFRGVALFGQFPDPTQFALTLLSSLVVLVLGFAWFMKLKPAFADVL